MAHDARRAAHVLAIMAALAAALVTRVASAQDTCDTDGGVPPGNQGVLEQSFPGSNEDGVPLDGFVRLRYRVRVPSRAFVSVSEMPSGRVVEGDARTVGNELHWQARARLNSNTEYVVHAADLSGTDTTVTFRTGFDVSTSQPPTFRGARSATFIRAGSSDLCGDPEALEVTVDFERATQTRWPASDIEYVIYQTAGAGISGPVERARDRGRPSGSVTNTIQSRSFRLASRNAVAPICFNVQATDPYGRADGNTVERCVNPAAGNFFVGCTVRSPAVGTTVRGASPRPLPSQGSGLSAVVSLAALAASMLRTRRR